MLKLELADETNEIKVSGRENTAKENNITANDNHNSPLLSFIANRYLLLLLLLMLLLLLGSMIFGKIITQIISKRHE